MLSTWSAAEDEGSCTDDLTNGTLGAGGIVMERVWQLGASCLAPSQSTHSGHGLPEEEFSNGAESPEPTSPMSWSPGAQKFLFCNKLIAGFESGTDSPKRYPLEVNAPEVVDFENRFFSGRLLFLHQHEDLDEASTMHPAHREHFAGRARCWELRLQGTFKVPPEEAYFGIEMAEPVGLSWARQQTAEWMVGFASMLSSARGVAFEHCLELETLENGDVLRPHFAYPLHAADVVIRTPVGEQPPSLLEGLPKMDLAEKMAVKLNTTDTFTIVTWTMYMNFVRWEICNLPFGWSDAIDTYTGRQPLHLCAFWREKDATRNVESKKQVFMRVDLRQASFEPQGSDLLEIPEETQRFCLCLPMEACTEGLRMFRVKLVRSVTGWC
mmetsp:Transcript_104183/g.185066  ORF Transcript_104183/g.185066 Transcript_104183/m.185066 type:complete len:382 (+) Transcript_104183:34-1179(+)